MDTQQNAFNPHVCWMCGESIDSLKKAHSLSVGAGLGLQAHQKCINALQAEVDRASQEVDEQEQAYMAKAKAEVVSGLRDWLVSDLGMKEVK